MTQLERTTHTLVPKGKLGSLAELHKAAFLCIDASSSMADPIEGGFRRIDRCREIVATLHQKGVDFRQIVFSDSPVEMPTIPEPRGGTNLADALAMALDNYATKIGVVSDGEPNSEEAAMTQARRAKDMGVVIDVMFCGRPGSRGEAFLQELAQATGGKGQTVDFSDAPDQLTGQAMLMLGDGTEATRTIAL
jgi:hypothetical protein